MIDSRKALLRATVLVVSLALPWSSGAARPRKDQASAPPPAAAVDPAFLPMLGAAVPAGRVAALTSWLRVIPSSPASAEVPLLAVLRDIGTAGSPKFEASDLTLELVTIHYRRLRIERARVVLMPSPDGRGCRFEVSGSPFGETTTFEAAGNVEWATGPFGGDKLDVTFRLGDAPVEAVRAFLPDRIDPSLRGLLSVRGNAAGVVGETTTEAAPATPLRGRFEAGSDWQLLGRTAPLAIQSEFSLDDRIVRLKDGQMKWEGLALDLRGWFDPMPGGKFDLDAKFANVDTRKVATEWNVPEPWRPASVISGTVMMEGAPGNSQLHYEASAPALEVPSLEGWTVRASGAKITGSLLAINVDVSASVQPAELHVGGIDLGPMPAGVQWWHDALSVTTANTKLWGGEIAGTLSYKPAEHPAFTLAGRLAKAAAPEMAAALVPWLGLDVDGMSSASFALGQDQARKPRWSAHASLLSGRLGNIDVFARVADALAAADASLALPADAAALLPKPRKGSGTRVDKLFFEIERSGEEFAIGRMLLRGGEFQLDADGSFSRAGGLRLDGTVKIPEAVSARLLGSAPWLSSLRKEGQALFVPVVISGPAAGPSLQLAPGYADLLARARRGEAVAAPGIKAARHVGCDDLATVPGDPSIVEE